LPSAMGWIRLSNDGLSKRGFSPVNMLQHEPLRAQSSNVSSAFEKLLCQIAKPIMHFKHSYMHNHAFYVLMHPIILLYHTYMLHIQLSTAKFNQSFNCQTQFQLSIPISNSTVKSNSISIVKIQSNLNFNNNSNVDIQ
jgi:hypothetical protein